MKRIVILLLLLIFTAFGTHATPQEKATKKECMTKCSEAVSLIQKVGLDEAIKQLNKPGSSFTWKDSYVFVFETKNAKLLSHPSQRLIGWSMLDYRSADNVIVFKEIIDNLTKTDRGWISYQMLIDEKHPVQKTTYYIKVPGKDIAVAAGYYEDALPSQSPVASPVTSSDSLKIEEFLTTKGLLHGIVFDGHGHMLVGKNGKQILKVSPDGTFTLFAEIKEADGYFREGPGHTFLYDMEFDSEGFLYAAVEDRILKISKDKKITELVVKKFPGPWGACGIAVDQKGNVFYSYDNKIAKLSPEGKNELFVDGGQSIADLKAIVGLEFSPDYRHLYACDGKLSSGKLVKIPVSPDGSAGPVEVLYQDEKINVEYITFDSNSNPIIKGPWSNPFIRVDQSGKAEPLSHSSIGFGIQTIAKGGKGFDPDAIFGTHMPTGIIYKIVLP